MSKLEERENRRRSIVGSIIEEPVAKASGAEGGPGAEEKNQSFCAAQPI